MISELRREYDKAKQLSYHGIFASYRERQILTLWCYVARLVYFARKMHTIEGNSGLCGAAKTSRKAIQQKSKDGGTQGYFRQLRKKGLNINTDPKSILKAESQLEEAGIVVFTRGGNGRVAIAHINIRAAALFLEAYHPDLEWLQSKVGDLYNWMPAFFDEVLGRRFNRLEDDSKLYEAQYFGEDLQVFEKHYPTVKRCLSTLAKHIRMAIERFCCRRRSPDDPVSSVIWWDVDISGGDPCAQWA